MNDVEVAPSCPTRVYAALGRASIFGYRRGGILLTTDNGNSPEWSSITAGVALHQTPIADVEVDPRHSGWVYAGSFGRGFWFYDWGEALPVCEQ